MRKKLFTLFLALAVSEGTLFAESGTCGDNLTWDLTDGVLTISGTGAMEEYDLAANVPWYNYRFSINSVTINDGVTSISDYAFYDCSSLTSINVSTDNTNYCSIDGVLFDKEQNTLVKCPGRRQGIYIIPNGVITIAYEAFYGCTRLSSVTIPNGVTSIGSYAFAGCNGLTSIEIPNSITNIEYGAFAYSFNLTSINVSTDNTNYSSIDGVLFSKDKTTLVEYPGGKQGAYTIPDGVVNIQIAAFMYRVRLTSIEIPNSVLNIGEGAFMGCSGLNSITNYSTQPQTIDTYCFYVDKSACTLYVPAQSLAAYQTADVWKEFGTILPIEGTETPIETVEGNYTIYYADKDSRDLTDETVTLHVPVAPVIEGFTFVEWRVAEGSLSFGITIQAIYEANEPTSAPAVYTNPANPAQKLIRNGNVYILSGDKTYTLQGQEVK